MYWFWCFFGWLPITRTSWHYALNSLCLIALFHFKCFVMAASEGPWFLVAPPCCAFSIGVWAGIFPFGQRGSRRPKLSERNKAPWISGRAEIKAACLASLPSCWAGHSRRPDTPASPFCPAQQYNSWTVGWPGLDKHVWRPVARSLSSHEPDACLDREEIRPGAQPHACCIEDELRICFCPSISVADPIDWAWPHAAHCVKG